MARAVLPSGAGRRRSETTMQDSQDRGKRNIQLALILGAVALGFFLLGMYLATGKGG